MTSGRRPYLYVPPVEPQADPTCRLQRPEAEQRQQTLDMVIQRSLSVEPLVNGIEVRLQDSAEEREKIETFIMEEADCCPFLAFEVWIEGNDAILRILHPPMEGTGV